VSPSPWCSSWPSTTTSITAGWDAYTALAFPEIVDAILASDFDPRIVNGFQSPTKPSALGHLKGTLRRPVQI
jgi:hypothetical protein